MSAVVTGILIGSAVGIVGGVLARWMLNRQMRMHNEDRDRAEIERRRKILEADPWLR